MTATIEEITAERSSTTDEPPVESSLERWFAITLLAVAVAFFFIYAGPRLNLPLGDSHDGRNAGTWAVSAKSMDQLGVVGSRLGAVRADGTIYANHPPVIVVATWLTMHVTGSHRIGARLPSVIAALASLALTYFILRQLALSSVAAAMGVLVGFTVPMFNTYGIMLDTPMLGLPFALAVVLIWLRDRAGRTVHPAITGVVAALAILTAWQCWLLVGLVAIAAIVTRVRTGRGSWIPMVVGAAVGAVLVVVWQLWVFGSLSNLQHQFLQRTDSNGPPLRLSAALRSQDNAIKDLVPNFVRYTAIAGLAIGALRVRTRLCVILMTASVVVYTVGLRTGAFFHDYWSYWIVALLGLGCAIVASELIRLASGRGPMPQWAVLPLGVLALVCIVQPGARESNAGALIDQGADTGRLVADSPAPGQRMAWCLGGMCAIAPWVDIETGLPMRWIQSSAELQAVATNRPGDLILMGGELPTWSNRPIHANRPYVIQAGRVKDPN